MVRRNFSLSFSAGERNFLWALIGTCLVGAILSCIAVLRLTETYPASQFELAFTSWTAVAGFVGAGAALWSTYNRWFGKPGTAGWISAMIGALLVSGIGSVVAGSLILPLYGTMFGPLQLFVTLIDTPVLAVVWFGMLMCAHVLLTRWRSERDSIFAGSVAL